MQLKKCKSNQKYKAMTEIINNYIDLAKAESEAHIKSNNKPVFHDSVNFRAHSCDF